MNRVGVELGIIIYIDNSEKMLEEFGWLYKSWIYSGCWRTSDIIVVHHPELEGKFPQEPGIITIPMLPYSRTEPLFKDYHFINSIACVSGPHIDPLMLRYRWILRTDADVFLTAHLADLRPTFPVHGRGNYHFRPEFREKMLDFCNRHNVAHWHNFGCGHSLLASSELMVTFLQRQMFWAHRLAEDFGEDKANWGTWPGWYRGVMSMYAAEIAANEDWESYLRFGRQRILDVESGSCMEIDNMVFHIHATHKETLFSKFAYRSGKYQAITPWELDRKRIGDYCLWLVLTPLETIKVLSGYPA